MTTELELQRRLTSPEAAVADIPSGGFIYTSGNAASPRTLLSALAAREDIHAPVHVAHVLLMGKDPFDAPGARERFRHHAFFVGPADRAAIQDGRGDHVPIHLHKIPEAVRRGPPLDAVLLSASPPDEHGYMSLGVEVMASRAAIERASRVIVQVNERMPRVHGDAFVHVSEATAIVRADEPLVELVPEPPSADQEAIAQHIAPLIPHGATLQLGIGGVPDAVLKLISDPSSPSFREDLGIHTEMISDGLIAAVESGAVTNRRKSLHTGKVILTFAMGTTKLYELLADNPMFEARPCDYVNDPRVIAQNDRMVALNSALSIDLTGQVNSDSIGTRIFSGFGGQLDFIRGAAASDGGVPIIALPSTARGGQVSRIVAELLPGAGVVTTRADVHWVVTEHGAVNLFGLPLSERARRLISIADPRFRDELTAAARARRLL